MFSNLIENALTHTPAGAKIGVTVAQINGKVVVDVFDNGKGVPVEEREKIFRRFYRLEESRTTTGTGLGLSLVAAIARLHGATIEACDHKPGLLIRMVFESALQS